MEKAEKEKYKYLVNIVLEQMKLMNLGTMPEIKKKLARRIAKAIILDENI